MKAAIAVVGSIFAVFLLAFVFTAGDYGMFKFWAPKYENAKRQVFENTQSYVNGKRDYIAQLRLEYESAAPGSAHQRALRTMILTEASGVQDKLPVDQQAFINSLKGQL